ncbi:UDP-N-acetylmuramoyl-L-alanine--D-glutamate ligase [soil metagenome]
MRLADLSGRRVVLLGLGEDVRAALGAIRGAGPAEVTLVDAGLEPTAPGEFGAEGVRVIGLDEACATAEVFVRSPGYPRFEPALVEAMERGGRMTTPLDLWMGTLGPEQRVVAITGTKGKSTTTELVGHFARGAGLRVGLAGNLGIPVFADGWDSTAPVIVLEVSSYQASDLHHAPEIAVLTSLTEDHLDWHGGVERYRSDKLRVLRNDGGSARVVIVSSESPGALEAAKDFDPVVVVPPAAGELPLQRVQNAALAAEVIHQLGVDRPTVAAILDGASRSLPGRLDPCVAPAGSRCSGVRFVDDALASNPSATAAGLAWAREQGVTTVLLIGGADRGVDPAPLAEEVARWSPGSLRAIALADSGDALAAAVGLEVVESADSVEHAVAIAADLAGPDGIVLFSPAAPTPRGSGNWETRSASFRRAIADLT